MIGNKTANKILKISKSSSQNNSETITNKNDKEILKERSIYPEERQNIIDNLRLIWYYNNEISKYNKFVR